MATTLTRGYSTLEDDFVPTASPPPGYSFPSPRGTSASVFSTADGKKPLPLSNPDSPACWAHLRPRPLLKALIAAAVVVATGLMLFKNTPQALRALRPLSMATTSAYVCPSPLTGRPADAFSDLSVFSPFSHIASSTPAFNLSISYSTRHCNAFRLRIARADRSVCRSPAPDLNEDEETTRFVREQLGPDTFQLQVDGAERLVVDNPARFEGDECVYEFEVALANSGAAWLQITHFYEDYDAYNSQPGHHFRRLLRPLLQVPLQLDICDSSCTPHVPPLLSHAPSVFSASTKDGASSQPLPACTGIQPIHGSYIPSALPSLLYPPYQLPQTPTRASAGYHTFVPSSCSHQHDGLRFRDHSSCLRTKRSALFIGDSHARGAFDVLAHRLKGSDEMALTSFKVANKAVDIEKLHLEFLWDAYAQSSISCSFIRNFDTVILSAGSHHACYHCPPTSAIVEHFDRVFHDWPRMVTQCRDQALTAALLKREESMERGRKSSRNGGEKEEKEEEEATLLNEEVASLARPVRFIYLTSPAWSPKPEELRDCRTAQRIGRWNELLSEKALEAGWAVVDAGEMTKPMQADAKLMDGVHYIKTDAIDPVVDELVGKMALCGNESPTRP
ncbi:hypothetical protein JCM8097_001377 [Rhodosporidiobolus ruineniae]